MHQCLLIWYVSEWLTENAVFLPMIVLKLHNTWEWFPRVLILIFYQSPIDSFRCKNSFLACCSALQWKQVYLSYWECHVAIACSIPHITYMDCPHSNVSLHSSPQYLSLGVIHWWQLHAVQRTCDRLTSNYVQHLMAGLYIGFSCSRVVLNPLKGRVVNWLRWAIQV